MERNSLLAAGCLIPLLAVAPAAAQDDDGEPVRCVRVQAIDRTEIIDDRTIVFHMRNGDIYVNNLDRECRDLSRGNGGRPFSYRTTTSQLCNVDRIDVLDNFGFGLTRGASCGLGFFTPATEEIVEMLKNEEPGDEEPEVNVIDIEVDEEAEQ